MMKPGRKKGQEIILAFFVSGRKRLLVSRDWFAMQPSQTNQPPFLGRLPGFFLLLVATPRSRLRNWPLGAVKHTPFGGTGRGVALRSASVR